MLDNLKEKWPEILDFFKQEYDLVILDLPPLTITPVLTVFTLVNVVFALMVNCALFNEIS